MAVCGPRTSRHRLDPGTKSRREGSQQMEGCSPLELNPCKIGDELQQGGGILPHHLQQSPDEQEILVWHTIHSDDGSLRPALTVQQHGQTSPSPGGPTPNFILNWKAPRHLWCRSTR